VDELLSAPAPPADAATAARAHRRGGGTVGGPPWAHSRASISARALGATDVHTGRPATALATGDRMTLGDDAVRRHPARQIS
jgi:hypothetical protein